MTDGLIENRHNKVIQSGVIIFHLILIFVFVLIWTTVPIYTNKFRLFLEIQGKLFIQENFYIFPPQKVWIHEFKIQ